MIRAPETYLATLRLIPNDILLAIAAQNFDEGRNEQCVCGWAFRESFARELNVAAESERTRPSYWDTSADLCAGRMGGTIDEWRALYFGAMNDTANVETAFVDRLNEIVR